jgi:hypothetical protein
MYRRVNLLLYLNRDWKEEYNGHLELWDADRRNCVKYLPVSNRTVIANIEPRGYHGLPEPIACPDSMTRKSLAIWYYTSELPEDVKVEYGVYEPDWVKRSESSSFLQKIVPPIVIEIWHHPLGVLSKFIPPVILDFLRRARS